ncbi:MAG: hypothetical protein RBJ76_13340 [Stenomitos frigidus ULC029]
MHYLDPQAQLIHEQAVRQQEEIEKCILDFLAACAPSTLPEILLEVMTQCGIAKGEVLPLTIHALSSLMVGDEIQEYPQIWCDSDSPIEFAWELVN